VSSIYLKRYAHKPVLESKKLPGDLELVIVVPCHNEPKIIDTIDALFRCKVPDDISIIVLVVINEPEDCNQQIKDQNHNSKDVLKHLSQENSNHRLKLEITFQRLPNKNAGVGLARKIGMDQACWWFEQLNKDGVIVNLDADCICQENYLSAIWNHFNQFKNCVGAVVQFEHPINGDKYDQIVYDAIIDYELFLRYYINALRFSGFPYAFQTLGSCMVLKRSAYEKEGGMNKRKAGEDFYFLNKIIRLGNFYEINTTRVFPSPRPSDRVPFGTGKSVIDFLHERNKMKFYHPNVFLDIAEIISNIEGFYSGHFLPLNENVRINDFLAEQHFTDTMEKFINNSASFDSFKKKFFDWFDAFRILKFVHYSRDRYFRNTDYTEAVQWLFNNLQITEKSKNKYQLLLKLRSYDFKNSYYIK